MTPEDLSLKAATGEMIKGCGGLDASVPFTRVRKTVLGDYQNPSKPDYFVPIDVVADLEPLARARDGWPHVTRALCQRMGGTFVKLPDAAPSAGDVLQLLGRQAKESSDVSQAICVGLADGKLCSADVDRIRVQIRELIEIAVVMDASFAAIEGDGRCPSYT